MRLSAALITSALLASIVACTTGSGTAGTPETLEERASYAIGFTAGQGLSEQGATVDVDQLVQGLRDALEGRDGALTDDQRQAALAEFQQMMSAAVSERAAEAGRANKEAGDTFLAENATKEGVVVLDSGLQYEVLEEGEGASPTPSDQVTVHYVGQFIDGTVFQSTRERGQPAIFSVQGVIPGFTEGLQLMKVGSKYRFFIPGELAYGMQPPPQSGIGANATLIFEVELLAINGKS